MLLNQLGPFRGMLLMCIDHLHIVPPLQYDVFRVSQNRSSADGEQRWLWCRKSFLKLSSTRDTVSVHLREGQRLFQSSNTRVRINKKYFGWFRHFQVGQVEIERSFFSKWFIENNIILNLTTDSIFPHNRDNARRLTCMPGISRESSF